MKKYLLCAIVFGIGITLYAQEEKSQLSRAADKVTDKFPTTRMIDIEFQQTLSSDFKSKLFKEDYRDGEIKNRNDVRVTANILILKKKNWFISSSLLYRYEAFDLKNLTYKGHQNISILPSDAELHYMAGTANFSYSSKLFGKPAFYNLSLIVDGSDKAVEAFKVIGTGIIVLKASKTTTITTGLAVNYDKTSLIPAIPVFTLDQKLGANWSFDFVMPQRIMFKKNISANGRLSLGSEFKSNIFYIRPGLKDFAKSYYYREMQIKSGAMYEYRMKKFIVYGKAGLMNIIESKMTQTGKTTNKYIYSSKSDPAFYFNLGISFNP